MIRPLILFDLTRLLSATGRSAPTGIERVEFRYARWLRSLSDVDVRFTVTLASSIRLVPEESVDAFLDAQGKTWADGAEGFSARAAVNNVRSFLSGDTPPPAPKLGHLSPEERKQRRATVAAQTTVSNPIASWAQQMAASWAHDSIAPVLRKASSGRQPVIYLRASGDRMETAGPFEKLKEAGVKIVVMTYDTIPLDYPEFVRPKAVQNCRRRVANMAALADGIVAISHYSAARLTPHLLPYQPNLTVAYLGTDEPHMPDGCPPLTEDRFFLMISTIEARKNHMLLLNLWRRMVDEMGEATPKLVIAGKRGWEAQGPLAMLDRARELAPYVYEAGAVPDAALHRLREDATAVLMPSFVEGFGLPVVEALSVNTPVIASDIPVFREIAAEACELLDPLDGPAWRKAICDYAAARSPRREAALIRARRFQAPTWDAHFESVRRLLDEISGASPASFAERARRALGSAGLLGRPAKPVGIDRSTDGSTV